MRRTLCLAALIPLAVVMVTCGADGPVASVSEDKQALAALQSFVGDWKGVGQPRRGSTQGAWTEQADWAWQFAKSKAVIAFQSPKGKFYARGELRRGAKSGEFELVATLPDGESTERFRGSLDEQQRLVLTAEEAEPGRPARITIRQVAGGDRMLILWERQLPGTERYLRLAEVGYTRQGSGFGKGSSQPECVVTGGYGSIAVQYEGKTYYVCCSGCRDLFNDDPAGVLAEYRERKQQEREAKQ